MSQREILTNGSAFKRTDGVAGAALSGTRMSTANANARAFPAPRKRKSTRK